MSNEYTYEPNFQFWLLTRVNVAAAKTNANLIKKLFFGYNKLRLTPSHFIDADKMKIFIEHIMSENNNNVLSYINAMSLYSEFLGFTGNSDLVMLRKSLMLKNRSSEESEVIEHILDPMPYLNLYNRLVAFLRQKQAYMNQLIDYFDKRSSIDPHKHKIFGSFLVRPWIILAIRTFDFPLNLILFEKMVYSKLHRQEEIERRFASRTTPVIYKDLVSQKYRILYFVESTSKKEKKKSFKPAYIDVNDVVSFYIDYLVQVFGTRDGDICFKHYQYARRPHQLIAPKNMYLMLKSFVAKQNMDKATARELHLLGPGQRHDYLFKLTWLAFRMVCNGSIEEVLSDCIRLNLSFATQEVSEFYNGAKAYRSSSQGNTLLGIHDTSMLAYNHVDFLGPMSTDSGGESDTGENDAVPGGPTPALYTMMRETDPVAHWSISMTTDPVEIQRAWAQASPGASPLETTRDGELLVDGRLGPFECYVARDATGQAAGCVIMAQWDNAAMLLRRRADYSYDVSLEAAVFPRMSAFFAKCHKFFHPRGKDRNRLYRWDRYLDLHGRLTDVQKRGGLLDTKREVSEMLRRAVRLRTSEAEKKAMERIGATFQQSRYLKLFDPANDEDDDDDVVANRSRDPYYTDATWHILCWAYNDNDAVVDALLRHIQSEKLSLFYLKNHTNAREGVLRSNGFEYVKGVYGDTELQFELPLADTKFSCFFWTRR